MATPKWERKGECNFCGYCCCFPFDPVLLFFPDGDRRREEFLKMRGFIPKADGTERGLASYGRVYLKCPHHQTDGKCGIFGKPERPQMCHDFPETPKQLLNTPCSYWFEDVLGIAEPIGGLGSPYPTETSPDFEPPGVGHNAYTVEG